MKMIAGNKYLLKKDNLITFDSVSLRTLLEEAKTPLMVLLENKIRDNIQTFNKIFNSVFGNYQGFYSFKANFLPEVCRIIQSEGIGAEIVGIPELNLALRLGYPSDKIIAGGPYLPDEFIEKCVINEVREIIIYNINDIKRVNEISEKYGKSQNLCLRINSQKFGSKLGIILDAKTLSNLKKLLQDCENVCLKTILSHRATQMNNFEQFRINLDNVAQAYNQLGNSGIKIENINLGGGFPEAVVIPEKQLKKIALNLKEHMELLEINVNQIYFEPGRYFVGDAGIFLTEIIKITDDRWIFLNIGNNICPKFARCSLRFYNASKIDASHKFKTSIAGIIPTDQDILVKDYFFTQSLDEGDIIIITNVGAYTLTFSNRFPYSLPPIILVSGTNVKKIFDPIIDRDFSLQ
ncbi:MAG: alanine racemase [Candidatus Lokiarchaeota archaeon]|nr:alanine racemase [Candidatus Lokiarchaeota archaeon]